ncbi:MAG: thiamine-phosphate kinase, partial [Xanthomonadales bacterium]|nr:thiamine-phosphate kinase [Xanthomonadales bacterium]
HVTERAGRTFPPGSGVVLGPGDDAALLEAPAGEHLVVTADTLVEGVHFAAEDAPAAIGHKALAVNLSDLAAMGASPRWVMLNLVLPEGDLRWLDGFLDGWLPLAERYAARLVGGDITRGARSITVQALGTVPKAKALRRSGARPGDQLWVSGALGGAARALELRAAGESVPADLAERLDRPRPRVGLGLGLRGLASACIDLSDGLLADLGHVLAASGTGARIEWERLPLAAGLKSLDAEHRWALAGAGGDDYELCFTAQPGRREAIRRLSAELGLELSPIGVIEDVDGLRCTRPDGTEWMPTGTGYRHFGERE